MQPARVGPYTVLQVLGTGSLGQVVLGRTDRGARVAVKIFRHEFTDYSRFRQRLREEIDVAARVRGPRVAAVLDADCDADLPWLATEYVPAPPLHEVLAAQGPLGVAAARQLGIGLAEALASIHAAGAVHGDLKPGNVLLAPDGPRVTDVGIGRAAAATPLTRGGALVGTLGYLAPEQVLDGRAGPPSDVFALGSLLLLATTWRRPFGDGDATAVLHRVLHGDPDLAGLTGEIATVVEACLRRNPDRRPGPAQVRATPGGHARRRRPDGGESSGPAGAPPTGAARPGHGAHPPQAQPWTSDRLGHRRVDEPGGRARGDDGGHHRGAAAAVRRRRGPRPLTRSQPSWTRKATSAGSYQASSWSSASPTRNSASRSPRSAASTAPAAWRTANSASSVSTCTAAIAATSTAPRMRTAPSSRSGRSVTSSRSADTTIRRAGVLSSPNPNSTASSRSDARAASLIAAYSSSSSSPARYASRSRGVNAKAVPPTGSNRPSATSLRSIGHVAGDVDAHQAPFPGVSERPTPPGGGFSVRAPVDADVVRSSSSASSTAWARTSTSASASRSPLRPKWTPPS